MNTPSRVAGGTVVELAAPSVIAQGVWVVAFAAATAVGAYVEVPHHPVPFTLQTLFVLLAGAFLGPRNGAISMVTYLVVGALGAPVFSSGGFGVAKLIGPTGGYLLAFPAAAAIVGLMVHRRLSLIRASIGMALGLLVIFTFGTIQLYFTLLQDWASAVASGFLIFSWWDLLKLGAATTIYYEVAKRWPRVPA